MDSTPPQQTVEDELQNKQSQNTETHTSETSSQNVSSTKTQYFRIGDDFHLKEFGHLSDKRERNGRAKAYKYTQCCKSGEIFMLVQIRGKRFGFRRYHPCRSAVFQKYRDKKEKQFLFILRISAKSKTKRKWRIFWFWS